MSVVNIKETTTGEIDVIKQDLLAIFDRLNIVEKN